MAVGVVTRNSAPDPRGMDAWGHYAVCPFKYIGPTVYAAGGDAQAAQVFKLGVVEYVRGSSSPRPELPLRWSRSQMPRIFRPSSGIPGRMGRAKGGCELAGVPC